MALWHVNLFAPFVSVINCPEDRHIKVPEAINIPAVKCYYHDGHVSDIHNSGAAGPGRHGPHLPPHPGARAHHLLSKLPSGAQR